MKKLKVKFDWPKESNKAKKAIDTLIKEGYTFHTYCTINTDGLKKGFSLEKKDLPPSKGDK
jgi:hypothetical protein